MKKSFIALLLLAISSTLIAAEYSKLDIKRAEFFANEAQKEFNLSKKATQQFQQLKLRTSWPTASKSLLSKRREKRTKRKPPPKRSTKTTCLNAQRS